jgi:hypothetical protein
MLPLIVTAMMLASPSTVVIRNGSRELSGYDPANSLEQMGPQNSFRIPAGEQFLVVVCDNGNAVSADVAVIWERNRGSKVFFLRSCSC